MSLSTMTNDLARPGRKQLLEAIAVENAPAGSTSTKSKAQKAFDSLAKFIPAEVLAPFIMVMQLVETQTVEWNDKGVFWGFVILTPLLLVLFEYAKTAEADLKWPDKRQVGWRAVAATIAFGVWALSVPGNPYQALVGGIAVAGLLAVLISPILSAIDAIVLKLLKPNP